MQRTLFCLRQRREFIDSVKVLLCSGSGGDGASVMLHLSNNEFAGPGGGNGGKGGNIMMRCDRSIHDLRHIAKMGSQIIAESGCSGYTRKSRGKSGTDFWLEVPPGTDVIDVDSNETLYSLEETGLEILLLEGGQGGKGNASFANKWNHSPVESTRGLPGNTMLAQLELKTIADCGLIGYPNAGKSSLLAAISLSKPLIAPYAFTTLRPYVGYIHDLYGNTCTVADIPGLIEGAYENRGLGHEFLRHVERTKALAYVVDMCATCDISNSEHVHEPWEVIDLLKNELEYYMPGLSEKAIMVFANKMDLEHDNCGVPVKQKLEELRKRVQLPVFGVSALEGIRLGAFHQESNLAPALQFMCNNVFKHKKNEQIEHDNRLKTEKYGLLRSFHESNDGLFNRTEKSKSSFPQRTKHVNICSEAEIRHDKDYAKYSFDECTEPLSLVDQQLSPYNDAVTGEKNNGFEKARGSRYLHQHRDLTMRGRQWTLTREEGEKLTDEHWEEVIRDVWQNYERVKL